MELTEQEIERMVMEASRAEYLAAESRRAHNSWHEETSTSAGAEPSSSRTSKLLVYVLFYGIYTNFSIFSSTFKTKLHEST
jgi:hypothetical protein